ncbi:hypothetical protein GGI07_005645 [Coemansia sp. Benny D115]|nr:hypothetical protein GGI07_005645 [Coemansia sp. Benny D115]
MAAHSDGWSFSLELEFVLRKFVLVDGGLVAESDDDCAAVLEEVMALTEFSGAVVAATATAKPEDEPKPKLELELEPDSGSELKLKPAAELEVEEIARIEVGLVDKADDVSEADPEIKAAYEEVRDDKQATDWMLLEFVDARKDVLKVGSKGSTGLEGLKEQLKDNLAAFGFIRVPMSNDELSQRTKFVLLVWCGPNTPVMRRAKLSVQKADVKAVITSFSIEIAASELSELRHDDILLQLKKAGGANYDRQTSNY